MSIEKAQPLTSEELAREGVTALPDKEVVSILDLAADVDLAIDGAAPVDLAVALNANVVAPIDAAVSANLLSDGSSAQALADQGVQVTQSIDADATATGTQDSTIDQSDAVSEPQGALSATTTETGGGEAAPATLPVDGSTVVDSTGAVLGTVDGATGDVVDASGNVIGTLDPATGQVTDAAGNLLGTVGDVGEEVPSAVGGVETGDLLSGPLLNVDVNVDLDADLAAPINGAVAANANVAAPIDAAVATNILSDGSDAVAVADQDAIISQTITGSAEATSNQTSDIDQGDAPAPTEPATSEPATSEPAAPTDPAAPTP